jgi:hypothetical protein
LEVVERVAALRTRTRIFRRGRRFGRVALSSVSLKASDRVQQVSRTTEQISQFLALQRDLQIESGKVVRIGNAAVDLQLRAGKCCL